VILLGTLDSNNPEWIVDDIRKELINLKDAKQRQRLFLMPFDEKRMLLK